MKQIGALFLINISVWGIVYGLTLSNWTIGIVGFIIGIVGNVLLLHYCYEDLINKQINKKKKMKTFNELPVEIQEKMLDEQELQGNKRDRSVFEKRVDDSVNRGGFDWNKSSQGNHTFWLDILVGGDFTEFYKLYPKEKTYPRVMMVSNDGDPLVPKSCHYEKNKMYITWVNAETIEQAKNVLSTYAWEHAKEVEELKTIEITMADIAKKFNCKVEQIKIK